jgi:hypothetical protein
MKKLIGLLSIVMLLAFSAQAQTQPTKQVGDPTTYMTGEQLAKYYSDIKIAELEKKLETYGNWVGVGGEVGTAIKEGLTAVVDVADHFGSTDVGKFTMILVAWKVIGKDIVRIVLGLIFIAVFTWLLIYSFKRTCVERRILVKKSNPGFMKYPKVKEYEIIEPRFGDGEGLGIIRIAHLLLFFIGIWITYGIMFAG